MLFEIEFKAEALAEAFVFQTTFRRAPIEEVILQQTREQVLLYFYSTTETK